jgi:hypothetical protein
MSKIKEGNVLLTTNVAAICALLGFLQILSVDGKPRKNFFKENFSTLAEGSYGVVLSAAIKKLEAALVSLSSIACNMEDSTGSPFDTQQLAKFFLIFVMEELSQK